MGQPLLLGVALDLFGSRSVIGREVVYGKRTYQGRQVADWDQSVILIRSDDADAVYTRIFLRPQSLVGFLKTAAGSLFSFFLVRVIS